MTARAETDSNTANRTARLAVAAYFIVAGLSFGGWAARIPDVQHGLKLEDAQLGLSLLGMSIGSIIAMTATGLLINRFGSRPVTVAGGLGACVLLPLLPLAPGALPLFLLLFAFGAFYGTLDVAMNSQAVLVEETYRRPIMSSFHGVFSVGGLLGAAISGYFAGQGLTPEQFLLPWAILLGIVVLLMATRLLHTARASAEDGPAFALPTGALAGLGAIGFIVLLGEGAIADWGAVFLRNELGAGAALAAAGYTVYSLAMASGRFAGDSVIEKLGPVRVIRYGGVLIAIGMLCIVLSGPLPLALVGFVLAGIGMAAAFPIVLSAAGRTPGVPAGTALAAVATAGYTGFLVGAPTIGFVSQAIGLRGALTLVAVLGLVMTLLANQADPERAAANTAPAKPARQPNAEAVADL